MPIEKINVEEPLGLDILDLPIINLSPVVINGRATLSVSLSLSLFYPPPSQLSLGFFIKVTARNIHTRDLTEI